MKKSLLLSILAIGLLLFSACGGREPQPDPAPGGTEYKIAVIFPREEWESVKPAVEWAVEDARKAHPGILLSLEWVDENAADLAKRVKDITHDNAYAAIIGPEYSAHARLVARESLSYRIPVLLPMVTSTEFQRIYAETNKTDPNIFCLAQNDVFQCEAALTKARLNGIQSLYMLCRSGEDDDYSASFERYFMFLAREAGFKSYAYVTYDTEEDLGRLMGSFVDLLYGFEAPGFFFVPASTEDMLAFDRVMTPYKDVKGIWPILCTDIANEPSLAAKLKAGPYEGFSLGATELFEQSWTSRFHSSLPGGYAQLYDALLLVAQAASHVEDGKAQSVKEALQDIIFETGYTGASGRIHFSNDAPITPEETIYRNWAFQDGAFSTLGSYLHNLESGWDWSDVHDNMVPDDDRYAPLDGHAAFIVATSSGWNNYRHQADALAMYQMLKGFGYTDDQIVLVMEDDVAGHPSNPHPGEVRVTPDGEDLRAGAVVDYKLSDLDPGDLVSIFSGKPAAKTPTVIRGGEGTNVLVFWSGHGVRDDELKWGDSIMKDAQFSTLLNESVGHYRKMFIVMDTCYSGSLAENCWGKPGMLFLCSAARGEPSYADIYDEAYGTYLSNSFTRAFRSAVEGNSAITLNRLYKDVARETTGSHAGIYNYYYYGSLYLNTFEEYCIEQ